MQNRRAIALLAAVMLLLCRLPVYAVEYEQGDAAALLDSGAGTTEMLPTPGNSVGLEPLDGLPGNLESGGRDDYDPLARLPADHQPDGPVEIALTEDWVIKDEQGLTLLSPQFANMPPSELAKSFGHPAITQQVTIQTNGHQIVVRHGGALLLEEFGVNGSKLCVKGEHEDGLFYVESGGKLVLNEIRVETDGVAVYLEENADYKWENLNNKDYPEPVTAGEAAPLAVVELYTAPKPLLVFDGEAWSDALPAQKIPTLKVFCSVDGQRENEFRQLEVIWDTEAQADALSRREDCVLEGLFPNGEGGWLPSRFTPELPVQFLPRVPVRLRNSRFTRTGAGDYYGELRFELPQDAQSMRLEVLEDDGRSWQEFKGASVVASEEEVFASFSQQDARPRCYRFVVEGGPNEGASDPVTLPKPPALGSSSGSGSDDGDDDNDFGGNRGGGTALDPPERELTFSAPESQADVTFTPSSADASTIEPTPSKRIKPTEREASAGGSPQAQPDAPNSLGSPDSSESTVILSDTKAAVPGAPEPVNNSSSHPGRQVQAVAVPVGGMETSKEAPHTLPPAGQAAAAAAGVAACGCVGILATSQTLRGKLLSALRRLLSRLKRP